MPRGQITILGEVIYEGKTPLVYRHALNDPASLAKTLKAMMEERNISIQEAIEQHERFGERLGSHNTETN